MNIRTVILMRVLHFTFNDIYLTPAYHFVTFQTFLVGG